MSAIPDVIKRKLTVQGYHALDAAGFFAPEDRVELVDGEIIEMAPIGDLHAGVVGKLNYLLTTALRERAIVFSQSPIVLSDLSEPQPDLAIARPRTDFYVSGKPRPADILWLIEVADTTLRYDRDVKLALYARHDIRESWLIDLPGKRFLMHRSPSATGYGEMIEVRMGQSAAPAAIPELTIPWSAIFG